MASLHAAAVLGTLLAAALAQSHVPLRAQTLVNLDQNWSETDQNNWYDATQGSRLIPLSWLKALEQPGGTKPFLADDHIAKFRYLPRTGGQLLPVGFAIDNSNDESFSVTKLRWKSGQSVSEDWVGFNCSACHTAEITFKGARMRVEGGPTLADFQGFMETLNRSLVQTRDDSAKFGRFASQVLGADDSTLNRETLKAALAQLVAWQLKVEHMNATDLRYGYSRLDAFGHIYNKVALVVDAASPTPNPANAPVSYPFLWNVPQQDWVQWNGIAPNKVLPSIAISQPFDIGALGRNAGEVIGVFADIKPIANAGLSGYSSSLQIGNLVSLEQLLGRLRPPAWPAIFGTPDATLVAQGEQLYQAKCQNCHSLLDRTDLTTGIKVKISLLRKDPVTGAAAIGTDPWMACNAYLDHTQSGVLAGMPRNYFSGAPLGADAPLADMLAVAVEGALAGEKGAVLKSMTASFFGRQPPPVVVPPSVSEAFGEVMREVPAESLSLKEQRLAQCLTEVNRILGYKARPLDGIWATAPFLHNGSVPTLYDLLLPPDKRPASFWVGTREFDPVKVGFVTTPPPNVKAPGPNDNAFLFRTRDVNNSIIDGNSNAGHDYDNAQLSDEDRYALIAFLKTL
ncbi:MAG: di-heme-cytochrome C peroxidase [Beijerinckiaceae bacterium]